MAKPERELTAGELLNAPAPPLAWEAVNRIADPVLLGLERRYQRIEARVVEPHRYIADVVDHVTPESWGIGFINVDEAQLWNAELQADLHTVTPQALLRDLHRPVRAEGQAVREPWMPIETHAFDLIKEAKREMERPPLEELRSSTERMREADWERRRYMFEEWKAAKEDHEPRDAFTVSPFPYGVDDGLSHGR